MKAHLLRPETVPPPPQLQQYLLERRFHADFGVPFPPLDDWPTRKIADYVMVQRALDEVEAAHNNPAAGAASSSGAAPAATEQAFQTMRAGAKPPPMPPSA